MAQKAFTFYEEAKIVAEKGDCVEKINLVKRKNVPPEILYYLATDTDPDVRAAVAASTDTPHQADLILAKDESDEVKRTLITKLAQQAQDLNRLVEPELGQSIDNVFITLASDASVNLRRFLVHAIKRITNLSKKLVMKIARDTDDEVAQAMVQSSPVLTEEDLDEFINERRESVVTAVASRPNVSEHTAERIVEAEFSPAVTYLLSNKTAKMSEDTLNFIANRADAHEEWHEAFVTREGLSLEVIKKLSLVISNTLIKVMLEYNYLDRNQVKDVMEIVQARIESGELDEEVLGILAAPPEPFSSAYDRAKEDYLNDLLHEDDLLTMMVEEDERAYIIGAISILSSIPYDLVIRELNAQNSRGLMAIIWKAGLSPQFGVEFQQRMAHIDLKKILYPMDKEFPMKESEMDWQLELILNVH